MPKGAKKKEKDPANVDSVQDALLHLKALSLVPAGSIDQPQAARMCPPTAHVWNNWKGAAWCGHLPGYERVTASWAVFGHKEACLNVLRGMWTRWLDDNDLANSACPVKGLFDASASSGTA